MTPRQARRIAVYSTGLNRAWGVTRTLKRGAFLVWGGATLALFAATQNPPVHTVEVDKPFPLLDLAMCRDLVARNRSTDFVMVPAHIPEQYATRDDISGEGIYNPKDAPVIAARIRAQAQRAAENERSVREIIKRKPVVVPKGGMLVR